jgi:hypothetical protein
LANSSNILNNDSIKILKKQTLPAIIRPTSASHAEVKHTSNNQVQVIEPIDKPPLPKNKPIRA